jgi:hypothetical protein
MLADELRRCRQSTVAIDGAQHRFASIGKNGRLGSAATGAFVIGQH